MVNKTDLATKPLVSIVILNWNGLEDTKTCLEHTRKLTYPNTEIIVVDNGSADGSKDYLSHLDGIVYIDNKNNRGFTGGHIDGLKKARGEYILLLNNDAVPQANYIEVALAHFADKRVGAVGGRAYFWNKDNALFDESNSFYSYMNIDIFTGEARLQSSDYATPQEVNVVSGAAVMVRREAINQVGYLYNRFFAYFEETDLFARMKRAGWKIIYEPKLHIWHKNGASSGSTSGSGFFYYQIFRNRFIFAVRNFEKWFLYRFLYNYFKIGCISTLKAILKPKHNTMDKAYSRAMFYNLATLLTAFNSRRLLQKSLGRSNYNHQISQEQNGLSTIVNLTDANEEQITGLVAKVNADSNPLHEFVLVIQNSEAKYPKLQNNNARYIIDRQMFNVNSLNIGCIVSRFSWALVCDTTTMPDINQAHKAATSTLGTDTAVILFSTSDKNRAPYTLMRKDFFERIGGLQGSGSSSEVVNDAISYADIASLLTRRRPPSNNDTLLPYTHPSHAERTVLQARIRRDEHLINSHKTTRLLRLQNRYYRLYQSFTFGKWLGMRAIPWRLKAGRIKNLIVYTSRLKQNMLATEFRHIRNEVLIYGGHHDFLEKQKKVISRELRKNIDEPNEIPVFIICRDRVEPLVKLIKWLEDRGLKNIVFIDNDSTFPPLLEYYNHTPYQVLSLLRNVGHTSPWTLAITRSLVPDGFYIVTDPDVIPIEECPSDVLRHFLALHKKFIAYEKVGFGLRIDDLPDHYPLKQHVISWESQFWKDKLLDEAYEAGLDTTFALYKPYTFKYALHPSIRTGYPYVARHLPWYTDPLHITEEEHFYRYRANHDVSSWNADELKDRYAKELQKEVASS